MTGIDTNVLVRYLVADDVKQHRLACEVMEKRCSPENPGLISPIVLCELVWVLDFSYAYSRAEISRVLRQLLITENLVFPQLDLLWNALLDYEEGPGDYADAVISRTHLEQGASTTVTFDRKAGKTHGFELLRSS